MFDRIIIDPNQMNGEPCIRNFRIPVATIITMIAQGMTTEKILSTIPTLKKGTLQKH